MVHLKRFVEKVTYAESRKTKDVLLPIDEARGLKDDIIKLLTDLYNLQKEEDKKEEVISITVKGGSFK